MERIHKAKRDYGLTDYYKFYRKRYNKVDKATYNSLLSEFNEGILELIIEEGLTYQMPYLYLELIIKKDKRKPKIVNGKLHNNVPVDWKATKELWDKDPEAREKKIRVRFKNSHTSGYVFRIFCKKFKCKLRNRSLYKFKPSRKFQRSLSARINDPDKDNFDAFLLY